MEVKPTYCTVLQYFLNHKISVNKALASCLQLSGFHRCPFGNVMKYLGCPKITQGRMGQRTCGLILIQNTYQLHAEHEFWGMWSSLVLGHGLSSWSSWALEHKLSSCGPQA